MKLKSYFIVFWKQPYRPPTSLQHVAAMSPLRSLAFRFGVEGIREELLHNLMSPLLTLLLRQHNGFVVGSNTCLDRQVVVK